MTTVNITSYGVFPGGPSYGSSVFVLTVQQCGAHWNVYRRYEDFKILDQQLSKQVSRLPAYPQGLVLDVNSEHSWRAVRSQLLAWFVQVLHTPETLSKRCVQDFLSLDANRPPPGVYLKSFDETSENGPEVGEMNMDDMFSGYGDDLDDLEDDDRTDADIGYEFDEAPPVIPVKRPSTVLTPQRKEKVNLDSFQILSVIGKGSFGKVMLVSMKETNQIFAMKVLRKENIIKRNQVNHTRTERHVLGYVRHPFIVGLNYAFQTADKLYFVLDYCAGGELFFHLGKLGKFPEYRARFYAAEITLALEYVHNLDIIYRDLKPENVLLDEEGHIRLTDFGLSKEGIQNNFSGAHSFCGTPEYLAPEILNRSGHGRAVDWWSLGALLYEMLTGLPPFYCRDRKRLFEKIRHEELTYPKYLSENAKSLLRGLLERDPTKRLGTGADDAEEIKRHPFFAPIDWDRLAMGQVKSPWAPNVSSSTDVSQFDREFTSMPIVSPDARMYPELKDADQLFKGFTYVEESALRHHLPQGSPQAPPHLYLQQHAMHPQSATKSHVSVPPPPTLPPHSGATASSLRANDAMQF